jgi:hypothetical protein
MSLEYAGTEGSAGSDASHERAEREASDGTASARQRLILEALDWADVDGMTWQEMAQKLGLHHGQATGSLSNLHKAGKIARLTEKRGRSSIYVLPEYIGDRATVPQGRVSRALAAVGYPYRQGTDLILGPEVMATLDGEYITWKGRRYHPLDSHAAAGKPEPEDHGRRPLFDV